MNMLVTMFEKHPDKICSLWSKEVPRSAAGLTPMLNPHQPPKAPSHFNVLLKVCTLFCKTSRAESTEAEKCGRYARTIVYFIRTMLRKSSVRCNLL